MKTLNAIEVINETMKLTGASIFSLIARTKTNEVAQYVGNLNIPHSLLLSRDAKYLENNQETVIAHCMNKRYSRETAEISLNELIDSAIKSLSGENARSMAQLFAYKGVNGAIKTHVETSRTMIHCYLISKKQLEPGEPKKTVKSSEKTLCKNEIRREFMKSSKYVQFDLERVERFKMAGVVIE